MATGGAQPAVVPTAQEVELPQRTTPLALDDRLHELESNLNSWALKVSNGNKSRRRAPTDQAVDAGGPDQSLRSRQERTTTDSARRVGVGEGPSARGHVVLDIVKGQFDSCTRDLARATGRRRRMPVETSRTGEMRRSEWTIEPSWRIHHLVTADGDRLTRNS